MPTLLRRPDQGRTMPERRSLKKVAFHNRSRRRQYVDLPATGFIPVVLGIMHYSQSTEEFR